MKIVDSVQISLTSMVLFFLAVRISLTMVQFKIHGLNQNEIIAIFEGDWHGRLTEYFIVISSGTIQV